MPAANHSFYLRNCYLENRLTAGTMEIAGEKLDLSKVKIPIFNLATREDHIAPALSVFEGSQYFGGNVHYVLAGSGHIAGVVNPPAKNKYQYWTGGKVEGALPGLAGPCHRDAGVLVAALGRVDPGAGRHRGEGQKARRPPREDHRGRPPAPT